MTTKARQASSNNLTRRKMLRYGLCGSLAASLSPGLWLCGCSNRGREKLPNIMLISMDTTRRDHCSLYGYERDTTPFLRSLAKQSTYFDLSYAPTSTTGPTHATVFTSLYPIAHGVLKNGFKLSEEHTTLAEILRNHDYQTAAIISSFVLHSKFGYAQGFESYDDDFELSESTTREKKWEGHKVDGPFDRRADYTTGRAIEWLKYHRDSARPFFLFVHYFDPHYPYHPPQRFANLFGQKKAVITPRQKSIDLYDAEIAFTDEQMGNLLETVRQMGLEDEMLVVIFSDHGEGLMQHNHMYHGVNIYEEAVRVPLLFRWPNRIPPSLLLSAPVELTDLTPTILDLIGTTRFKQPYHGKSLAGTLLSGSILDTERSIYLYRRHYEEGTVGKIRVKGEKFGVRVGPWKYIEGTEEKTKELYNLNDDPLELANLDNTLPEKVVEFGSHLDQWKQVHRTGKSIPEKISEDDLTRLKSLGYVK